MEESALVGKNQSLVRKLYLSESPNEKTFQYDESLPPLPVPELEQTIEKYLKSIEPFVSPEQYEKTKIIAKNFENGIGKTLQKKLKARASQHKNWLAEWWIKYAYLMFRDPLIPCANMSGPQSLNLTIWQPKEEKALEEAALSLWAVLDFFSNLRGEKIRVHSSKNGEKLAMNQFRYIFNTTRIPKEGMDEIKCSFKTKAEGSCPQHIIVICFGHIWVMDPWYSPDESLSVPEIEEQFKYIRRISEALGEGQGVGILTCDNRELWAKNRRWLSSLSGQNAKNLHLIDCALLVCSLDENSPKNLSEVCKMSLCENPKNRWADKSYVAITFKNGYHSISNDHTPFDAMVGVVIGGYQHGIITDEFKGSWNGPKHIRKICMPRRLVFTLDDLLITSIERIRSLNQSLSDDICVNFREFNIFGKNLIQQHKLHPDAFVQCALQLAYYQIHKKFAPTYETATTRQFYQARTETVRSCTPEATDFVKAMMSETASMNEKRAKLIRAVKRHVELMKECQNGEGIDRHLMGLSIIAAENGLPTPELFTDPSYKLSGGGGNFVLSTSTLGYTLVIGGVAAMVKEGYGVFYIVLNDRMYFYLTNYVSGGTCLEKFFQSTSRALIYMQEVVMEPHSRL